LIVLLHGQQQNEKILGVFQAQFGINITHIEGGKILGRLA
jgi:hypothetical protein